MILIEKVDECPLREKVFNYFQLVYVVSGSGRQWVNDNVTPYQTGDLFLLTPDDSHSFDVFETTEFLLVKFNNSYIHDKQLGSDNIQRMEYVLSNARHKTGYVLYNESDKWLVKTITESIIRESINDDLYSKEMLQQLMNTLILIVARNIASYLPKKINDITDTKIVEILQYIQTNIYAPEKLRINTISLEFGLTETYVSRYFKKHTENTLQEYITQCRMNLIENRLRYSDMRIGEIAFELGFTDESHLNRFFNKNKHMNPSEYRKGEKVVELV